jgi:hypothetical protein
MASHLKRQHLQFLEPEVQYMLLIACLWSHRVIVTDMMWEPEIVCVFLVVLQLKSADLGTYCSVWQQLHCTESE